MRLLPRRPALRFVMALALLLAALAGCATLDEKQREWIFQPSQRTWWGGAQAAEGMQEVWIPLPADDGHGGSAAAPGEQLHALWLPQPRADAPVLLYLHGARWDVRSSAHRMRRMHELGFAVLGIDYRGFGQSSPRLPSEQSALADARSAWHWLATQQPAAPRFVFGHSLGGAIAVALAAEVTDERGLLVEGSFTSIPDVVATYRMGWLPVGALIAQRFDAGARIAHVGSPVLVVHGSEDRTIQPQLGRALYDKALNPKRFILVEGGSHHNTNALGQALYRDALRELFGLDPT
ncbi:alpha/beta hydrolase fold protein [Burkholderiales bacterium JOSHI_001]|nr:alpha/beta hydrolase fold protein [Burkholderiales bacterium JOSHI_001]